MTRSATHKTAHGTPEKSTHGTNAKTNARDKGSPAEPAAKPPLDRAPDRAPDRALDRALDRAAERSPERATVLHGDADDNTVTLRGRVSSAPIERELPSGAVITTFRMSMPRARTPMTAGSNQTSDWVDCTAWTARTRRSVGVWLVGDQVEVTGALRRRFFRLGSGPSTRLEVEVLAARRARARLPPPP